MAGTSLDLDDIVDSAALRAALTAAAGGADGDGSSAAIRASVRAIVRQTLVDGRVRAEAMLRADGSGRACAARLSHLMDEIIRALHEFAIHHVYRAKNLSTAERIAICAVGGYGRSTLAPGSDIDLLFLLPYKQTPLGEQVLEYILYMLWDLGLKVGHSTRSIDECIRLANSDLTIRTALLDARLIQGNAELFETFLDRYAREVMDGAATAFVNAKLAERDERHKRSGESRYLVEPNIKDGKGGLRDLQTLFWIAKFVYRVRRRTELVKLGVFSRQEYNRFIKAEDFLWAVRCHMHFLTGKAEERLSFDIQREMAARLGYTSHAGLMDVERFMKHYFLVAKDVGDLTRIFCAALEEEQVKQAPGLNRFLAPFQRRRKRIAGTTDFVADKHRITIADKDAFRRDPVNLIRLFWLADEHELEYHPDALKEATRSLRLIDADLRNDPQANRLFLNLLTSERNPALTLRRMNEAGVLGRFVPDFGRIVAMMQFNMYHHYTVDEHLIRTIAVLSDIEHGQLGHEHPLANELMPGLKGERRLLYVALFLHDIAKGRREGHSVAGARIARRLCPRFGLTPAETDTVAWLVEEHLAMSMTAQARDLNDRKTIEDFAARVQTLERLKLLLVLTVCDIKAVGPGVWNGWKGQLLRTLYHETELLLTGGFSGTSRKQRIEAAKAALGERLTDWSATERKAIVKLHYPNYFLTVDLDDQRRHAEFIRQANRDKKRLATMVRTHAFHAITEITVLAPDHPRLLSVIAAACTGAGANIVDAQIFTTTDGRALDTILINREFEDDADELRRAERVGKLIEEVLSGKVNAPETIARRRKGRRVSKTFHIEPRVEINNTLSNRFSVIEIEGLDRPGLLSDVTGAISDLSLDIASAHITTFGEKVIDSFYVTDLVGAKLEGSRIDRIRRRLLTILSGEASAGRPERAGFAPR